LTSNIPNFLKNKLEITACYIGKLAFPSKKIDENDDSELAHLNTTAE